MKKYIVTIDRRKHLKHPLVERVVSRLFKPWSVGVVWCHNMLFNEFYVILKNISVKFHLAKKKWQLCLSIFMKYRFNLSPGEGLGLNGMGMTLKKKGKAENKLFKSSSQKLKQVKVLAIDV